MYCQDHREPIAFLSGHRAHPHLQQVQHMLVQAVKCTVLPPEGQLSSPTYSRSSFHTCCHELSALHAVSVMSTCIKCSSLPSSAPHGCGSADCSPRHWRQVPGTKAACQCPPATDKGRRGCEEVAITGRPCSITFTLIWSTRHLRWGLCQLNTGDSVMAFGKGGALLVQPSNSWLQPNLQQQTLLRGCLPDGWAPCCS